MRHVVYQWFGVKPRGLGWWAAAVQLLGTLFFNVTTFEALNTAFTASQQNLRVWSPDFVVDLLPRRELVRGQGRRLRPAIAVALALALE
mgnify:CR=1 FL=1